MSEFWAMRKGDGLQPHTMEDAALMARIPFGKPIKVTAVAPRNGRFHALFWVLCTRIGDAVGLDADRVCYVLKIQTGHAEIIHSKKYGELRIAKSISFAAMDETAFRAFFEKCVDAIYAEWAIARADVLAAVSDLLTPQEAHLQ